MATAPSPGTLWNLPDHSHRVLLSDHDLRHVDWFCLLGIAIGLVAITRSVRKYDVTLSDSWVEGPVVAGLLLREKRCRVRYEDIDPASASKVARLGGDPLKLRDGRRLIFNGLFLSRPQIRALMAEVNRRQPVSAGDPRA